MKTIQGLIHTQFSKRTIVLGDKAINSLAVTAAFIGLISPFVLIISRLH